MLSALYLLLMNVILERLISLLAPKTIPDSQTRPVDEGDPLNSATKYCNPTQGYVSDNRLHLLCTVQFTYLSGRRRKKLSLFPSPPLTLTSLAYARKVV